MLRAMAITAAALLAAQAAAQSAEQTETAEYRQALTRCVEADDMICAIEVLLNHGRESGEEVVVSVEGGPTVFGTQLYAVLDRAQGDVPPETFKAMTEAAVGYALDAQPDVSAAPGPFILLNGEACVAVGDRRCAVNAASAVQLMLTSDQWYFPGIGDLQGDNDARARAQSLVDTVLGAQAQ